MKQYKVLSLDIWDTVIRRRCHPDEIKLATARYLYLTEYQKLKPDYRDVQKLLLSRVGAERLIASRHSENEDDEYYLKDVFAYSLEEVLSQKADIHSIIENMYQAELDKEIEMAYLDPSIIEKVSQFDYEKLGYISDFYAGSDFIDKILERIGFPLELQFRFVSCEQHLNKRSGKLFEKALSELNINAEDQLHIGDNQYSDFEIPMSKGIHAIRYLPDGENQKRKQKERMYSICNGVDMTSICDEFARYSGLAGKVAPFFTDFITWILESCAKRNIKKIYYFTREGEFFIQLHDAIAQNGIIPERVLPKAQVLEVSRVATFAASLREPTLEELMRLWNQYSVQSMDAFAKSLAMDEKLLQKWLKKYNVKIDEVITYPWQDSRIRSMFLDSDFIKFFQNHIDTRKKLLLDYCREKQIDDSRNETIAIVDIGWRGTIQDNLCYLFPNTQIVGFYLALEQFLNPQPMNAEKYGFMNGESNYLHLLRIVSPIEMLCNSPFGSVIGYDEKNGEVIAKRKNEIAEDQIFEKYTGEEQRNILKVAVRFCSLVRIHSLMSEQTKDTVYTKFADTLLNPQRCRDLPIHFFELQHNEEFGVGCFVDKRFKLRADLMLMAVFSSNKRKELKKFLVNTSWPQGYLAKYHLDALIPLLNKKLGIL